MSAAPSAAREFTLAQVSLSMATMLRLVDGVSGVVVWWRDRLIDCLIDRLFAMVGLIRVRWARPLSSWMRCGG